MEVSIYKSKPNVVRVIKWEDRYFDNEAALSRIEEFCDGAYIPRLFTKDDIKDGDYLVKDLFENVTIVDGKEFLANYDYVAKLSEPKTE